MVHQAGEIRRLQKAASLDEDEALACVAQDIELPAFVRMQAYKHEPAVGAQPAEEIEHEPDIAVLGVELRLVEQMHVRRRTHCPFEHERWPRTLERPHLIRLVVMKREAVALAVAHAMDVLAQDADAPG